MADEEQKLEHLFFMVRGLRQALTQGIEFWAEDTARRTAWLNDDDLAWHTIAGTMLTGTFSYTEGKIGRFWWNTLRSEAAKRDLQLLWMARNAFTHGDSKLGVSKFSSAEDIKSLKQYCDKLAAGEILDDHENAYPAYMTFEDSVIRFTRDAIQIFAALFEVAYQAERLNRM